MQPSPRAETSRLFQAFASASVLLLASRWQLLKHGARARLTDPVDPGTGRPPQRTGVGLRSRHGHQERDPRVPDLEAREDHARAGGSAHLRHRRAARARAPPEEVALLAGVSVDYYTRLERGNAGGVSETVLEALARALQLDEAERAHLFDLARATQTSTPRRRRRAQQQIRPTVQHMLDAMAGAAGVRAQRPARHPRREPARPRAVLGALRQPGAAAEHRAVRLPRPPRHRRSTPTGTASRTTSSPSCAPKPAATRTTASSRTSSASCRRAASCSGRSGPPTTSAGTTPGSSASVTRSSAS